MSAVDPALRETDIAGREVPVDLDPTHEEVETGGDHENVQEEDRSPPEEGPPGLTRKASAAAPQHPV